MPTIGQRSNAHTIRHTLFGIAVALLLLQLLAFGQLTWSAWQQYQVASATLLLNELIQHHLKTADNLDEERALTVTLLARATVPTRSEQQALARYRANAKRYFAIVKTEALSLTNIDRERQKEILKAYQHTVSSRDEVDSYLSNLATLPNQSLAYSFSVGVERTLDTLDRRIVDLSRKLSSSFPDIYPLSNTKLFLWNIRRSLSTQSTGLIMRAELNRPLHSTDEADIERSREYGNVFMERLYSETTLLGDSQLSASFATISTMLAAVEKHSNQQIAELAVGKPLTFPATVYLRTLHTDLELLGKMTQRVSDRTKQALQHYRSSALATLAKSGCMGLLSLALSLCLLWIMRKRIIQPLTALQAIQDAASEAILIIDAQQRIVMANKGAQRLFQLTEQRLLSERITSLVKLANSSANSNWSSPPFTQIVNLKGQTFQAGQKALYINLSIAPISIAGLENSALVTVLDDHSRQLAELENKRSLALILAITRVEESLFLRTPPDEIYPRLAAILAEFSAARAAVLLHNAALYLKDGYQPNAAHWTIQATYLPSAEELPTGMLQHVQSWLSCSEPQQDLYWPNGWQCTPIRLGNQVIGIACLASPDSTQLASVLQPWAAAYGSMMSFFQEEAQLIESDNRLKQVLKEQELIFSASPVGLLKLSPSYHITHANEASKQFFGAANDTITGKLIFDSIVDNACQQQLSTQLAQLEATHEPQSCEILCQRGNSTFIWGLFEACPVLEDGSLTGIILACIDTTARKHGEIALRDARDKAAEARQQLVAAIEAIPEAFAFYNVQDQLILCNQHYADIVQQNTKPPLLAGHTFEEIVRKTVSRGEATEPGFDIDSWVAERVRRHRQSYRSFQLQIDNKWYRVSDHLIPGLGYVGILSDITDIKAHESQLEQARNQADSANRAKSAFLAAMSHEIRTPMNGVLGMLELLSLSQLDPEQQDTVSTIQESARSLLRLIDDILDFSKIEAGKLDLYLEPASIQDIGSQVRDLYGEIASRKGLKFHYWIDKTVAPAVLIDALRLRQVLHNFLSNAVKFTLAGTVTLHISVLKHTSTQQTLQFTIEDTGIGIASENIGKLLQPFTQAESDTTRRFGGTGLGLAVCKRLAELMEGDIQLQSQLGQGTTATLVISAAIARTHPLTSAVHDIAASNRLDAPLSLSTRLPILYVEDNPINRKLTMRQLSLLEVPFIVAEDGRQALELWHRHNTYSLVLTDCHMPYIDGYHLAAAIRAYQHARQVQHPVPIIACTANASKEETERCWAAGMNDILTKPLGLSALRQMLSKWLGSATASPHLDPPAIPNPPSSRPPQAASPRLKAESYDTIPIDRQALEIYSNGDIAIELDLLQEFLSSNQDDLNALHAAVISGDADKVAWFAHRIKGASRMVGALALGQLAETLEEAGKTLAGNFIELFHQIELEQQRIERWWQRTSLTLPANNASSDRR